MSVISHIIEATNFTSKRADFNIPALLCDKMKLCHVGVYGVAGQPLDPVLGQLAVIDKITLRDGGVILSQYNRNIKSAMKLKLLTNTSNDQFRSKRRVLDASLTGLEVRNSGVDADGVAPGNPQKLMMGAGVPKICVDKKDPVHITEDEESTRFAILDLADVLGWCNAVYTGGSAVLSGTMPCHIHKQLKLSVEFAAADSVLAESTIAQPYLIFHEAQDAAAEKAYMNPNLVAQYADWEMESVYLNEAQQSKVFLNSFFNKTLSKLAMITDATNANGQSTALGGEVFRLLVNNTPYFQLTTGLNHPAKKAAFTRLAGYEMPIALHSDKPAGLVGTCWPNNPDEDATSICEGANPADVSGSLWYRAANSYLILDINQKISNLQIDWSCDEAAANAVTLQFWGQVEKLVSYSTSAPVVAYA